MTVHVYVAFNMFMLNGKAGIQLWLSMAPKALPFPLGHLTSPQPPWVPHERRPHISSFPSMQCVILLLLNQRKPGLTMLFLSAFWIVYPVMAAFPSSFGGVHDRATFSPQTSSIFTSWGGPGRSTGQIHSITGGSLPLQTFTCCRRAF